MEYNWETKDVDTTHQ